MATQLTPSKKVRSIRHVNHPPIAFPQLTHHLSQAASNFENLKMGESPAKKLSFEPVGKENIPTPATLVDDLELKKPVMEIVKPVEATPKVADTIKAEEADEPLLQENPHRFVLFPIKYHEVRDDNNASRVNWPQLTCLSTDMADVQEGRGIVLDC
jgi:hypothetical protein